MGRGFEPHRRHWVVSGTGATQEDLSFYNRKNVDGTNKQTNKQTVYAYFHCKGRAKYNLT